jgi:hypothetical protein
MKSAKEALQEIIIKSNERVGMEVLMFVIMFVNEIREATNDCATLNQKQEDFLWGLVSTLTNSRHVSTTGAVEACSVATWINSCHE